MAFPATPLDATVELDIGGWTDVTADALGPDEAVITIQRGRMSEGSRSAPTWCDLSIRNTYGTYSPRNPSSPYYGSLGRNTPLRVYTGSRHQGAGDGTSTASTSHVAPSVSADTTGLLICGWMADSPVTYTLPGSMTAGPSETDGTYSTLATAHEAVSAGATGTRTATADTDQGYAAVSAVLHGASVTVEESLSGVSDTLQDITLTTDAATQAGWWLVAVQGWVRGSDVPMPDAPYGDGGGWILLGESPVVEGDFSGTTTYLQLRIWARRVNTQGAQRVIFGGIAAPGAADNQAALYVLSGVDDWSIRATVEVSSWPPRWDVTGASVWVPIKAQGILRRLGQGLAPLESPLRRALTGAGATVQVGQRLLPVDYWPLEDGGSSTWAAPGLPDRRPLRAWGEVGWAQVSSPGSLPLPDWSAESTAVSGPVVGIASGDWSVGCLVQMAGSTSWTPLVVAVAGGLYGELRLGITSTTVTLQGVGDAGTTTLVSAAAQVMDQQPHWIEIQVVESGGSVFHDVYLDGTPLDSSSAAGSQGRPVNVRVQPRTGGEEAALGHLAFWSEPPLAVYSLVIESAVTGHAGETAGRRFERLCREERIPVRIVGDPDNSPAMGAQPALPLLELLWQCEDVDGGILYEPREVLGLGLRLASSRYSQPATLALTYGAEGEVSPPLEPEDDDRYTANDVTASRPSGSSARVEVTEGPLSVLPPPDGVGRYDTSVTVNVAGDDQLSSQASWRAHLGTWDEARYPTVRVNLAALGAAGKTGLMAATSALDCGDRLTISDPPVWLPPGPIDQGVEGYTETLGQYAWDMRLVCAPAGPWRVWVLEDQVLGRLDTSGSELALEVAEADTSLLVATDPGRQRWITIGERPQDFPFALSVGGEVVRVDAIGEVLNNNPWMLTGSTTGWSSSNSSIAYSTAVVRSGYGSVRITPSGSASNAGVRDAEHVPVTAGATYRAALWAYSPTGWAGGIGPAVDWYDAADTLLSTSIPTPTAITAGVWTPLVAEVTAPATAVAAAVRGRQAGSPSAADIWYATGIVLTPLPTGSPQPFTVTRSVNGVVLAHPAGTRVRIAPVEV